MRLEKRGKQSYISAEQAQMTIFDFMENKE